MARLPVRLLARPTALPRPAPAAVAMGLTALEHTAIGAFAGFTEVCIMQVRGGSASNINNICHAPSDSSPLSLSTHPLL